MKQKTLPPLNWLRAFEVSARCLNFTHAAEELFLTQGAVSQQIRQLESHLGVALFKRLPRGLGLTEEGQAYLPVVQDAITRLAVGTNEIFGQHKRRPIKVRGSLAFFVHWLAPKLAGFSQAHPHVDIRYISNIWVKELDGEDDMEIRWGHGQWPGTGVAAPDLGHVVPGLLAGPDGEVAADGPFGRIAPSAVACSGLRRGLGLLVEHGRCRHRRLFDRHAVRHIDLDFAHGRVRSGIALARSSMVEEMLQDGRLVEPFTQRIEASESFYLVRGSGAEQHPDAVMFSTWLVEQAHRFK